MTKFAALILVLTVYTLKANAQVNPECNFSQRLDADKKYTIYNPGYPAPYSGQNYCRWVARARLGYKVTLECQDFYIPESQNCTLDRLSVDKGDRTPLNHSYCGSGKFRVESKGREMILEFVSSRSTPGGRFFCIASATRRKFLPTVEDESQPCKCGYKKPTRIVGGNETGINEYPMMAGIIDADTRSIYCGGGIISTRHILTAAHCLTKRQINRLGVVVGEHDVSTGSETNATQLFRIQRADLHPQYNVQTGNGPDVALITVQGVIPNNNQVGPACLPIQHRLDTFAGSYVEILGWGTLEFAGPVSRVLEGARVSVVTNTACARVYPNISANDLCTYARGRDACQFDSGGPVLWENPTTRRLVLVGVINYGRGCAASDPGVNARVGSYLGWVVNQAQVTAPGTAFCPYE